MKQAITEESGVHKAWIPEAHKQTVETLPEFLRKLCEDYRHDYGTYVHAAAAAAIGAVAAFDHHPDSGGMTGFQAGCLGWEMIREYMSIRGPARLLEYENLIFPQYDYKFEKTITAETWAEIQKKARQMIAENRTVHPDVLRRWESIVAGELPNGFALEQSR